MAHDEEQPGTEAPTEDSHPRVTQEAASGADRPWASERAFDGEVLQLFE
jgi:hypothetical protein